MHSWAKWLACVCANSPRNTCSRHNWYVTHTHTHTHTTTARARTDTGVSTSRSASQSAWWR
jgi:hypothetical protein